MLRSLIEISNNDSYQFKRILFLMADSFISSFPVASPPMSVFQLSYKLFLINSIIIGLEANWSLTKQLLLLRKH